MSGTKSPYPPAPAIDPAETALVMGWYGSRNEVDHVRMDCHLASLTEAFGFADGLSVPLVLGSKDSPSIAIGSVRNIVVLPVFMCDGMAMNQHFPAMLRHLIARHAGNANIRVSPIVGRHESLARLVAERATGRFERASRRKNLLLVAHGSERNRGSVEATRAIRDRIRAMGRFEEVTDAYLEMSPNAQDVIAGIKGDCVVEGLFLTEGRHSTADLQACLHPVDAGSSVSCLGAVGIDPRFIDVLSSVTREVMKSTPVN